MATETRSERSAVGDGVVAVFDRALYALFSRHADSAAHDRDRHNYRAANLGVGFEVYLARVYGLSWAGACLAFVVGAALVGVLPRGVVDAAVGFLHDGIPVVEKATLPSVPLAVVALLAGGLFAVLAKWATVRLGGLYLGWHARARRADIEATLTGSLDAGLELVARDTPSRDLLAPFLLKYREHANQGADALVEYLDMEGHLLSHRQSRTHDRVSGYLELLAELFVVLLVFPALTVLIITVMSVLAPGLSRTVTTPVGAVTTRQVLVYSCALFVLGVGAGAAGAVGSLRPTQHAIPTYTTPGDLGGIARSATTNPASAAVICVPLGVAVALVLWLLGYAPANVVLLGYVAVGLPVGAIAVRRARLDDAKDREIRDFVHAVSGHVALGRPFSGAVDAVAREVDHGALQEDVEALAFTLSLTTDAGADGDARAAALDRFVEDVGTPMAEQTIGLVVGALDAGSDAEKVFETLQTEIGRLYHERKELRSSLLVYVAVGWTTGLLVLGIMVAVNLYVLDGFAELAAVSAETNEAASGLALNPDAVDPERDRWRFYLVTQATMLACGWFAGMASRGRYEALLHSAGLVALGYVVFAGVGLI